MRKISMNSMHIETATPARFVKSIHLHGLELAVLNAGGIDYIPAKPLCDLAGVNWRTARRTLETGDNARLFGTKRLVPPQIEGLNGHLMVKTGGGGGYKASPLDIESVLCMRMDCSRGYLFKISTDRMRAKGNHDGADQLHALQKEWAKVLHAYETHGIAVKAGRANKPRELLQWVRLRDSLKDPQQRRIVEAILDDELNALGLPADTLDDSQLPLPLPAAPVPQP